MDRIETYPMGLDEASESEADEASASNDGRSRRWAETLPDSLPGTAVPVRSTKTRRLGLFAAVVGLFGLVAYALRAMFRR
jgi:hypothetical protein